MSSIQAKERGFCGFLRRFGLLVVRTVWVPREDGIRSGRDRHPGYDMVAPGDLVVTGFGTRRTWPSRHDCDGERLCRMLVVLGRTVPGPLSAEIATAIEVAMMSRSARPPRHHYDALRHHNMVVTALGVVIVLRRPDVSRQHQRHVRLLNSGRARVGRRRRGGVVFGRSLLSQ
ncbi:hypothetical protein Taro_045316 [Colocasia esculenta]|uniref:Uncharacterized protein n=1 Tax=Colocasia esculenta TaxID=4460 RepID=A0A843WQY3_COLES|nr:hypothetical protein [Colocasia esculenta]